MLFVMSEMLFRIYLPPNIQLFLPPGEFIHLSAIGLQGEGGCHIIHSYIIPGLPLLVARTQQSKGISVIQR